MNIEDQFELGDPILAKEETKKIYDKFKIIYGKNSKKKHVVIGTSPNELKDLEVIKKLRVGATELKINGAPYFKLGHEHNKEKDIITVSYMLDK